MGEENILFNTYCIKLKCMYVCINSKFSKTLKSCALYSIIICTLNNITSRTLNHIIIIIYLNILLNAGGVFLLVAVDSGD